MGEKILIRKNLVEALKKYGSKAEVARRLGVSRQAIGQAMNRFGIQYDKQRALKLKRKELEIKSDYLERKVLKMARSGYTSTEIAEKFNLKGTQVRTITYKHGFIWDHSNYRKNIKILKLYKRGYAIKDILRKTDLKNYADVMRILRRFYFKDSLKKGEHRRKKHNNKSWMSRK